MQELLEYSNVDLLNLYAHTATVMHSELLGCRMSSFVWSEAESAEGCRLTVMRLYHLRNNDSMACLNEAIEISMRT